MEEKKTRKMLFLFSRFHFSDLFGAENKKKIYENLLKMEKSKKEMGRFYWAFGDVGEINIDNERLIYGRLGKTAKERFETVYNETKHSYSKELIKVNSSNYSNFFIMPSFNVIAFEQKYEISKLQFLQHFKEMWIETTASELQFEFMLNEVEAYDLIKGWKKIVTAKFTMVPTNPSSREDFAPLDEFIRKANAAKAKLSFENKEKGLNFGDSPISQGVSMSAAGYGEFDITGIGDKERVHVSSKGLQISRELVQIDDLATISPEMMKEIRKIVEAMNKNGRK